MTNHDIAKIVDTSDEWIRTRTGIIECRIAAPKENTSTLATAAARQVLSKGLLALWLLSRVKCGSHRRSESYLPKMLLKVLKNGVQIPH
jgi:hypothetical protein